MHVDKENRLNANAKDTVERKKFILEIYNVIHKKVKNDDFSLTWEQLCEIEVRVLN